MALSENASPVIMVVDDCEDIREMLKVKLNLRGYRVLEAANGQEAIETAKKECPDLILMDLNMPVLDGYAAVRLIRNAANICKVPIIACSSHDTADHRAKAFADGFNEYLTKPVDFARLESIINNFLMVV